MTVYVQTESGSAEVFKTIYVCERCGRVAEIDECPAHGLASRRQVAEPEAIATRARLLQRSRWTSSVTASP